MAALAFLFQGLFFTFAPAAYQPVVLASRFFGYKFACFDLHGGWKCEFTKIENGQPQENPLQTLECHENEDCVASAKGTCSLRILEGIPDKENSTKCVCLTGPIIYGCLPEDEAKMYDGQKTGSLKQ